MKVTRHSLPNGLRIVHYRDKATAMAVVNLLYDVGSRDEDPSHTGLAHLFEHLMFSGSENVPDFDLAIQNAGGHNNAWTSTDFTNFYDVVPAQNIETAMWAESDRMRWLNLNEKSLDIQRKVVIEEFKQTTLNVPYGDLNDRIHSLAYKKHPYRWTPIGKELSHIEKVTLPEVRDFYNRNYGPDTAILSITGNIDSDKAFSLAEKWFGDLEPCGRGERILPQEPIRTIPRTETVYSNVPSNALSITFPMKGYKSDQFQGADLLTDVLASGLSSRFYQNLLLKTGLFSSIDSVITGTEDPGLLIVNARFVDNSNETLEKGLKAIDTELRKVVEEGVSENEVVRSINRYISANIFSNISYLEAASKISLAEYHGEEPNENLDRFRSLTPETVNRVAREIIDPNRASTLFYLAK